MTKRSKKTRRNSKNKASIARRRQRRSKDAYGTSFELLEDRKLLAGITVGTAVDFVDGNTSSISSLIASPGADGAISLREAITAADNTQGQDTITFDAATFNGEAADVIRLQSPLLVFDSTTIDAGNLGVVVSGDTLGNDVLVAGSFIADVAASELAGTFDDNTEGVFVFAGAIFQNATISGLTITGGDSSDRGGGIFVASYANLDISQSTIAGNRAASGGGGIQSDDGNLTIDQSSISENVANSPQVLIDAFGGGIASSSGNVVLTNSTVSGNVARGETSEGGGIFINGTSSLSLANSTVSGNSASSPFSGTTAGGGIFTESQTVSIVNSTITENTASFGGGIANNSSSFGAAPLILNNSIVAGNLADVQGPDIVSSFFATFDVSFSLIGDNSGTLLTASPFGIADADGNLIGTQGNVIDPQLGALADNGGPTLTHALLPSSPANNAGNSPLAFDQRGNARVGGSGSDIGAFEQEGIFIVVDSSDDFVDFDFSPGNLTLREAIDLSESTPEIETITFDPSVFNGEQADVIHLQSTLTIFDAVTIDAGDLGVVISGDTAQNDTLVDGTFITDIGQPFNDFDNVRVFEISVADQSVVTLSGLTITGGSTPFGGGGGILSNSGSLVIEDSVVSGNLGDSSGGGIYAATGSVTITGSNITANATGGFYGFDAGGGGVGSSSADITIVNSLVNRNFSGVDGGGVHSRSGSIVIVDSTISENNSQVSGGGIGLQSGDLIVTGSTVSGNDAALGFFGGGGGIFNDSGTVTISNSTISGNSSEGGTGIYSTEGAVTITDSTITQNQSRYSFGSSAGVQVGGGSFFSSPASLTVRNSIIAGNTQSFGPDNDIDLATNVTVDITSSIIGSNFNTPLLPAPVGSPNAAGNLIGTDFDPIDPLLGNLADNGGPTQTHALLANSPAIDAGVSLSTTDQRGEPRPVVQPSVPNPSGGNGADIGAVEFQSLVLLVDSSIDLVDGDFSTGNLSLREAITLANDNLGANDVILFSSDVFDGELTDVIRLQTGELQITEGVTINAGDSNVVVSADALGNDIVDPVTFVTDVEASGLSGALFDNDSRVFNIATTVEESVTLTGLTITGGNAAGGGGGIKVTSATLALVDTSVSGNLSSGDGGGVLSDQDLTLTDSTISGNIATGGGGGIAAASGIVTLNNSIVTDNRAAGSGGGGIRTTGGDVLLNSSEVIENTINGVGSGGGISTDTGTVTLNDSIVSGNESNFQGGGISTDSSAITVNESTISGNEAAIAGGGIYTLSGAVSLSNSVLNDNSATYLSNGGIVVSGGGGIFAATGSVSIDQSTVSGNGASGDEFDGGAIRTDSADVTVTFSTFDGNSTFGQEATGGAIATNSGDVNINSSTFSGNRTFGEGSSGGAVATNSGDILTTSSTFSGNSTFGFAANGGAIATTFGRVTISSSTITENKTRLNSDFGGAGGGIYFATSPSVAPLSIQNSIVAGNSSADGNDIKINTDSIIARSSLIGDNTGTFLTAAAVPDANGNLIGSDSAPIDPLLGVLSDHGGVTQTHALLAGSPAIDSGDSSFSNDQRGTLFVRTAGNATDIGAFETQVLNLLVDTDSDVVNGDFSSRNLSLREAIELTNANPGEDSIGFSPAQFRGNSFDAIHLTQGELTITESVNIDGEELEVVVTGDRLRDDVNFSDTAITDLSNNTDTRLDDNSRVFNITAAAGEVVALGGLVITGGISSEGGAIRNAAADLVIERSTIAGNRVSGNGGGILSGAGSVTISNSTISGNLTTDNNSYGGGIHTDTGAISLANSTVSGNRATGIGADGGGISTSSGDVTINSATIIRNSASGDGGGVFVAASTTNPSLSIRNTIVAENSSPTSPDLQFGSSIPFDISFSLIGNNSGTPLGAAAVGSPDASGNLIGSSTAIIVPLLGNLADNGGLTLTHQPLEGSPVINAGGSSTLATDQRNNPALARDDSNGVDIGAVEFFQSTLVVDTSSDVVDGDLTPGNLSLREALAIANINPATDTITFDATVFDQQPADVIRLQLGQLTISSEVLIDAAEAGVVISGDVSGNDVLVSGSFITDTFSSAANGTLADNVRVIDITAAESEFVSITGITITGGYAPDTFDDGGGIRNEDATLLLTDVTVSGNRTGSSGDGGGVFTDDGALTLVDSIISENFSDSDGGGIYSQDGNLVVNSSTVIGNFSDGRGGGIYANGDLATLNDSSVSDNRTGRFGDGGGIFTLSADVRLNNSSITANVTDDFGDGGGISSSSGDVILNNSSVSANTAGLNADGGGIDTSSGDVFVNSSTISGNQSSDEGGGIHSSSGNVTFNDSSLSNNTAGDEGGGVSTSSGDLTFDRSTINGNLSGLEGGGIETLFGDILLRNSTVSGNQSGASGGGIYQDFGDFTRIVNSTIFNNQSDGDGGGIHHAGASSLDTLIIENSIVAGNVTVNGIGSDLNYSSNIVSSVRNSLIGSNAGTPLQAISPGATDADGNLVGTAAAPIDPLLGALADNGGPTLTHALLAGSPAINAGGSVSVDIGNTDQRGEARISDGQIDIGAFELGTAFLLGDSDQNGVVDFSDIPAFISVLQSGGFLDEADINRDGVVDFSDISFFIDLLILL